MQTIFGRVLSNISEFYKDINPSTLSGAIDVIVVEDVATGDLVCSPFHVRFGKLQVLRPGEKKVDIEVNGKPMGIGPTGIGMKIGLAGETFFVVPVDGPVPSEYLTSPLVEPVKPPEGREVPQISLTNGDPEKSPIRSIANSDTTALQVASLALSDSEEPPTATGSIEQISRKGRPRAKLPVTALSDSELPEPELKENEEWTWKWGDLPERGDSSRPEPERTENPVIEVVVPSDPAAAVDTAGAQQTAIDGVTAKDSVAELEKEILGEMRKEETFAAPEPEEPTELLKEHLRKRDVIAAMYDSLTAMIAESIEGIELELFSIPEETLRVKPSSIHDYAKLSSILKRVEWSQFEQFPEAQLNSGILCVRLPSSASANRCCHFRTKGALQLLVGLRLYKQLLPLDKFLSLCDVATEPPPRVSWRQWWTSPRTPTATKSATEAAPVTPRATSTVAESPTKSPLGSMALARASSSPDLLTSLETKPMQPNYSKSLRLPSEELRRWDLRYGMNTVTFSVMTSKSGKATCTARIFLWRSEDKLIISDIDGTITKSDALGHLFHFVGKDWTHSNIANLFTDIAKNGYRFMYLTSRAIGQANSTRGYLRGIEQNTYQLPEGPVIMSPDRFFTAVRREVIEGNPEQFKIPCLLDIRRLFTVGRVRGAHSLNPMALTEEERLLPSPFYAGFGNRHTDAMSYAAVGIPISRIYIVNPEGNLSLQVISSYRNSYGGLVNLVDQVFPPLNEAIERDRKAVAAQSGALLDEIVITEKPQEPALPKESILPVDAETYNDFYFWRQPLLQPERLQLLNVSNASLLLTATPRRPDRPDDAGTPSDTIDDDDEEGESDTSQERTDRYYFEEKEEAGLIPFA